ncbi:response regulator [Lichenicoccus sp.]|uniref:response regulator n=1 Tax=Lichenicoccus sp. TaxID=2781899 RepID=UPI003D11A662
MHHSHVLLVEDEATIRMILAEVLADAGFVVTEAASGEVALRLFDEVRAFDLLVTDVHMPGRVNGVDLARAVRARWPEVPVVFVTGRPDALRRFGDLGPRDRFVLKPCRSATLLSAVESSLAA